MTVKWGNVPFIVIEQITVILPYTQYPEKGMPNKIWICGVHKPRFNVSIESMEKVWWKMISCYSFFFERLPKLVCEDAFCLKKSMNRTKNGKIIPNLSFWNHKCERNFSRGLNFDCTPSLTKSNNSSMINWLVIL